MVVLLTLLATSVLADQTQLFSKIYLAPYYREGTIAGTTYNYTLSVNPPDKLTAVFSATITFQAYLSPSVNFTLLVNNKTCNTPNYYVSTTYATSGQGTASFDCSNVINKSGNYTIQLVMSKNTGAINGWLDLTYTNKPIANMDVFGTEYKAGEDGTIFLLLKDPNGIPISNATCVLDIYYPLSANNTHNEWINDGLMRYLEEGLYYYDFIAPLYAGVYMVNAKCSYLTSGNQYYTLASGLAPIRNATYGTFTGDPFVLDDYGEWLYTQCDSGTAGGGTKACDVSYEWNLTAGGLLGNVSQLFVQYLGENNGANLMVMYWWNWSSNAWVLLPNNMTFHATASSGVPIGVDEYLTNSVPLSAISPLTRVRIRLLTTSGSTFKQWDNMLVLKAVQYGTTIQDLKGSGEIHISSGAQGENNYFRVDTCDGYVDGRCGIFTNDDEFDLVEGEIEDFLNISASSTRTNLPIHYETPFSVDCSAIYWVKEWNGTDWVDFTNFSVYSQPTAQDCIMTFYKDVVSGTSYQFWIKMDNYMKWEVEYTNQISSTFTSLINPLCSGRNFTYTTPITETTPISNDTITDFCHRSYDDLYWLGTYYNDSIGVEVVGEYASYLQESRFYRQELFNRYNLLSNALTTNQILAKIDALTNLTNINLTAINNQLLNITGELVIHKNLLNQILTYLQNTIYPYLQQIWNKLLGIETQLNTTINITNQSLVLDTEINQTTHNLSTQINNLNNSMWQGFAEKDAHIQSAYDNMSSQLNNFSANTTQNFNLTWEMILALNQSGGDNSVILSYLANITQAINTTQTQLSAVNQSLTQQIQNTSNNTQTLIIAVNSSTQTRFDEIQAILNNLTILVSTNHNITQQNISALMEMLIAVNTSITTDVANLNTSLYEVRADLLSEINQTYNTLLSINQSIINETEEAKQEILDAISDLNSTIININQTNSWILEVLNVSTNDLNLIVSAPSRCLADTNWLAKAQVRDRFGNTLSYLDGVECNMTTDLWGTSNMTYVFVEQKFKYIHLCDPANTTFNWSVNCARVS